MLRFRRGPARRIKLHCALCVLGCVCLQALSGSPQCRCVTAGPTLNYLPARRFCKWVDCSMHAAEGALGAPTQRRLELYRNKPQCNGRMACCVYDVRVYLRTCVGCFSTARVSSMDVSIRCVSRHSRGERTRNRGSSDECDDGLRRCTLCDEATRTIVVHDAQCCSNELRFIVNVVTCYRMSALPAFTAAQSRPTPVALQGTPSVPRTRCPLSAACVQTGPPGCRHPLRLSSLEWRQQATETEHPR
jgi:hypothetical protein